MMMSWVRYFQVIETAAQAVLRNLHALDHRRSDALASPTDRQVLALFARKSGDDGRKSLEQSAGYLQKTLGQMLLALSKADIANITTSAYQVGGFSSYLYDVHDVEEMPAISSHPLFVGIRALSAATRELAAAYSPDYDASDSAISAELAKSNPWS